MACGGLESYGLPERAESHPSQTGTKPRDSLDQEGVDSQRAAPWAISLLETGDIRPGSVFCFCFLRQGLIMLPRLAVNWQSFCLSLTMDWNYRLCYEAHLLP